MFFLESRIPKPSIFLRFRIGILRAATTESWTQKVPKFYWYYVGFLLFFRRVQEKWSQKHQETIDTYAFSATFPRKSPELVCKIHQKWLEGSQKLESLCFEKVAKPLHKCNGILMIWKRDFLIFAFLAQSVTFYALKRNTFSILRKSAEFWRQNHQYCNGKTYISSFSESDPRGAELLVFTMPKLVFWAPFAKTPPRHPNG